MRLRVFLLCSFVLAPACVNDVKRETIVPPTASLSFPFTHVARNGAMVDLSWEGLCRVQYKIYSLDGRGVDDDRKWGWDWDYKDKSDTCGLREFQLQATCAPSPCGIVDGARGKTRRARLVFRDTGRHNVVLTATSKDKTVSWTRSLEVLEPDALQVRCFLIGHNDERVSCATPHKLSTTREKIRVEATVLAQGQVVQGVAPELDIEKLSDNDRTPRVWRRVENDRHIWIIHAGAAYRGIFHIKYDGLVARIVVVHKRRCELRTPDRYLLKMRATSRYEPPRSPRVAASSRLRHR